MTRVDRRPRARTLVLPVLPVLLLATSGLAAAPAAGQDPGPVQARPDTIPLPGLVVTATRVPQSREALPTQVTILTGDDLRERGLATVAEALRSVPGVTIARSGAPGAQTSMFLRGGESDYVKVLVDGVPVNDPGGHLDLADLSTDHVDRIEVVRGPVSVVYGSDAVTGVVQIFTRRGQGDPTLTVTTLGGVGERRPDGGTYGAFDTEANLTGEARSVGYSLGASRSWSAGAYPFNSDRRHDVLSGRLDWRHSAGGELAVFARVSDSDTGFPTDGAGNLVDENARMDRRVLTAGLDAGHHLGDRVVARLQLGLMDRDQVALDRPDGPADTLGVYASRLDWAVRRVHADARLDVDLPATILSMGTAFEDDRGSSAYESESEWGPYDAAAEFQRQNRAYYVQLVSRPLPSLDLLAGGRVDDNEVFGTFHTYRVGASWGIAETRVRAALGRGFREPSFAESFGSGFGDRGNPDLAPEESRSWEVGVEQRLGRRARAGATWFDQRFANLIQYTFVPPQTEDANYFNVGEAVARGLELSGDLDLGVLQVSGSYTRLATRVVDPGLATDASFVEGESLLRRPRHAGSLSARYAFHAGVVGATAHYVGRRADLDFGAGFPAPRTVLDAHTTLDGYAQHDLSWAGPATTLLLRVQNLTDARYQQVAGFPAPGRLFHLGARVRIGT